jgi:hypothetical protein
VVARQDRDHQDNCCHRARRGEGERERAAPGGHPVAPGRHPPNADHRQGDVTATASRRRPHGDGLTATASRRLRHGDGDTATASRRRRCRGGGAAGRRRCRGGAASPSPSANSSTVAVARDLGVALSALYRWVADRAHLLDLVSAELGARLRPGAQPTAETWRSTPRPTGSSRPAERTSMDSAVVGVPVTDSYNPCASRVVALGSGVGGSGASTTPASCAPSCTASRPAAHRTAPARARQPGRGRGRAGRRPG